MFFTTELATLGLLKTYHQTVDPALIELPWFLPRLQSL